MPHLFVFILGFAALLVTHCLFLDRVPGWQYDEAWAAAFSNEIATVSDFYPLQAISSYTGTWSYYFIALVFKLLGAQLLTYRFCGVFFVVAGVALISRALHIVGKGRAAALFPGLVAFFPALVKKGLMVGLLLLASGLVWVQDSRVFQEIRKLYPIAEFVWSPYQRVKYREPRIYVNGIGHQEIVVSHEDLKTSFYNIPYSDRAKNSQLSPFKRVLIIGAGSGNDVAAALMNGADHVDAVEIDPAIANLGKLHHPLKPYDDSRVRLTIDDGRSFLTRGTEKYDLIILALTDSLVKISPMAQLRLENYLFTKDSVERAVDLLSENGSLIMYNSYREGWLIDKLRAMMFAGSGSRVPEVLMNDGNFAMFKVTRTPLGAGTPAATLAGVDTSEFDLPTDNWPFLYLKRHGIPSFYILPMGVMFLIIIGLMTLVGRTEKSEPKKKSNPHKSFYYQSAFVLMGIAFLLLETKSVIQFSLLFGTTWLNSSLVFLAVLISVLAANWTTRMVQREGLLYLAFGLLVISCLVSYQYPISQLLYYDNKLVRFLLASILTFSPIFFANLIFSIAFSKQDSAEKYFGWNLIGATIGGILEYLSMALGYHSLTVIVTVCYVGAFVMLVMAQQPSWKTSTRLSEG